MNFSFRFRNEKFLLRDPCLKNKQLAEEFIGVLPTCILNIFYDHFGMTVDATNNSVEIM